jgi:hypothetical protein
MKTAEAMPGPGGMKTVFGIGASVVLGISNFIGRRPLEQGGTPQSLRFWEPDQRPWQVRSVRDDLKPSHALRTRQKLKALTRLTAGGATFE